MTVEQVVETLLNAGYRLRVNDGDKWITAITDDADPVLSAMIGGGLRMLWVYRERPLEWRKFAYVVFVNGVVDDHSVSLEDLLGERCA